MSWKDDEASMLSSLTLSVELPSLLCQSYATLHDVARYGAFAPSTLHHACTLAVTKLMFRWLGLVSQPRRKFWVLFALIQVFQLLLVLAELYEEENDFVSSLLVSTIAMMVGEVSPLHPDWVNAALFAKHLGVWTALGRRRMKVQQIGVLPVIWAFFLILMTQFLRRKMLIAKLKAEQSTKINEQRLNAILQSIPDGIVVLSESQQVLTYNQTLLKQLNITPAAHPEAQISASILNLRYDPEYITESDTEIAADIRKFTCEAVETVTDFKPVRLGKTYLECRGCISQWDDQKVCVLTIRDTSNWVALEKKAKSDSANKTSLLRSVSHELRTPTNAILNLALDIKSTETLSAQGSHDIEILISATKFLMSIINDLLDFSRILHDSFTLARHAFKLEPVIRECAQMIEPQCREKHLDFRVRYDPLLPEIAYTDENRLKQVVLNLLSNAAKYVPHRFTLKGAVTLVAMMAGIDRVKISVEDTGIGIAPEKQKGIFSLFGMIQGNQVLNPQGCGLGLSISSMLVQRLGGAEIALASAPKQGSVFSFEIPILNAEMRRSSQTTVIGVEGEEIPDEYGKNSPTAMREPTEGCESGDVLVVDDAPFNRLVVRKILETAGYSCVEASTGVEAIDHISGSSERGVPFAVVIMDIEMPEMDGITATKQVRELVEKGVVKSLPFIIGCSAFSSEDDQRAALSAGMNFYIEKPVARATLLELVARCVRASRI